MAILTTQGIAKYNAAVASGSKILIKKLVFGSNTGPVSASTTNIGSPVFSFERVHTSQAFGQGKISLATYMQLPVRSITRQAGLYDDTGTLIAVEQVTLPGRTTQKEWSFISLILFVTKPDVFDSNASFPNYLANAKNAVKMQRQSASFFEQTVPPAQLGKVYKYNGVVPTSDWLMEQANIVETNEELALAMNAIPSMEEMFNTWYRFSHSGANYPALPDELNGWSLNSNKELSSTINSSSFIGFVSPDKYINYEIDTQVYSRNSDDDGAGIMVAFNKEDKEYSLSVMRCPGGWNFGWKMQFNYNQSAANKPMTVANKAHTVLFGDGLYHTVADNAPFNVTPPYTGGGWNKASQASGTRIKVTRNGDIITAQCSDFGSTTLIPESLMTVNLADYPALAPLRKPASYGYCCISQANTFWNTTSFIDKDNVILDIRDGKIYTFNGSEWVVTSQTLRNTFGVNKFLYSRVNKKSFYVNGQGQLQRVI